MHIVVPGLLLTQNTNQLIELDTLNRRFVQSLIVGGVDFGDNLAVLDFLENARKHAGLRRAVNALDGCGKVVNGDRRVGKREIMLRAKDADLVEVDIALAVRMVGVVVRQHVDEVDVLVVLVHDAPSTCAHAARSDLLVQVDIERVVLLAVDGLGLEVVDQRVRDAANVAVVNNLTLGVNADKLRVNGKRVPTSIAVGHTLARNLHNRQRLGSRRDSVFGATFHDDGDGLAGQQTLRLDLDRLGREGSGLAVRSNSDVRIGRGALGFLDLGAFLGGEGHLAADNQCVEVVLARTFGAELRNQDNARRVVGVACGDLDVGRIGNHFNGSPFLGDLIGEIEVVILIVDGHDAFFDLGKLRLRSRTGSCSTCGASATRAACATRENRSCAGSRRKTDETAPGDVLLHDKQPFSPQTKVLFELQPTRRITLPQQKSFSLCPNYRSSTFDGLAKSLNE